MAPLPPESTARYVVRYTSGGREHTQQYRFSAPPSPSAFGTFADGLWTELDAALYAATILDVTFYPDGITFGNIVDCGAFSTASYGDGTPNNVQGAQYLDFVGRGSDGRRVRLSFFSPNGTDATWRFDPTDLPAVGEVVTALNGNADLCTIGGGEITWKNYANFGYNAYWQRERRS